jgi:hypothetical protein
VAKRPKLIEHTYIINEWNPEWAIDDTIHITADDISFVPVKRALVTVDKHGIGLWFLSDTARAQTTQHNLSVLYMYI